MAMDELLMTVHVTLNNAFVTGSFAYGTPRKDSDIDLVVLVDTESFSILAAIYKGDPEYPTQSLNIKKGLLNLIVVHEQARFDLWRKGTEQLKASKPVARVEACKLFKELGV